MQIRSPKNNTVQGILVHLFVIDEVTSLVMKKPPKKEFCNKIQSYQ